LLFAIGKLGCLARGRRLIVGCGARSGHVGNGHRTMKLFERRYTGVRKRGGDIPTRQRSTKAFVRKDARVRKRSGDVTIRHERRLRCMGIGKRRDAGVRAARGGDVMFNHRHIQRSTEAFKRTVAATRERCGIVGRRVGFRNAGVRDTSRITCNWNRDGSWGRL